MSTHTTFEVDVRVKLEKAYFYAGRYWPEDSEITLKAGDALGRHMILVEAAPTKAKPAKEAKVEKAEPEVKPEEAKVEAKAETKADPLK
jgi:hypothetical protein